jgi:adenosylmethionine-8-amino-7-oxononanoate aminotransferase
MLENTLKEHGAASNVAAFIGETIIGTGGIITPPKEYWPLIREICDNYGILLILDEVMAGLGRAGKMWACEYWDVEPDMITISKGINSMYQAIGATLIQDRVYEKLVNQVPIRSSHTVDMHPVACAAALANLDELENGLVENSSLMGKHLNYRLQELSEKSPLVGDVGGKGLFQRLELVKDKVDKTRFSQASKIGEVISDRCQKNGMIIRCLGFNNDTMQFTPPLIIRKSEIDHMCDIMEKVLEEVEKMDLK